MTEPAIRVTHAMTYADFMALWGAMTAFHRYDVRTHLKIVAVVLLVGMACELYWRWDIPITQRLVTYALVVVAFALYCRLALALSRRSLRQRFAILSRRGAITYEFFNEYMTLESPNWEDETNWSEFVACIPTQDYLFLLLKEYSGYVIPKKAFVRPSEFSAAIAFAKERVHGRTV